MNHQPLIRSASMLTPIPINRTPTSLTFSLTNPPNTSTNDTATSEVGTLRGRMEQQVDAIAGSANKVISGVVGTSFGVLRMLLPGVQESTAVVTNVNAVSDTVSNPITSNTNTSPNTNGNANVSGNVDSGGGGVGWNPVRPGFGLLRRETGLAIAASIAASLPGGGGSGGRRVGAGSSSGAGAGEEGQMLVTVSRPASVRSGAGSGFEDEVGLGDEGEGNEEGENEEERGEGEEEEEDGEEGGDSRSIQSFESMMTGKREKRAAANAKSGRKSLSDRLAHMSGFSRLQSKEGGGDKVRLVYSICN
jgi:hypothetical protein